MLAADALRGLATFLYSSDRAVLQLLHVLNWQPVLQQVAPVIAQLQASDTRSSQSSLMDTDQTTSPVPDSSTEPASAQAQRKSLQTARSLDAGAKAWAANLVLLALPTYVILADADLPAWLGQLTSGQDTQHLSDAGAFVDCKH